MKLKKNAWSLVEQAASERLNELKRLFDDRDVVNFVGTAQCGLLSYEDLVEPSKLSLEDEFWSCISVSEKERHPQDIKNILKFMQANKMAAAMDEVAALKDCYISDTTARQIYSLIEDYMNNKEEYDA